MKPKPHSEFDGPKRFRRFGDVGPMYEVVGIGNEDDTVAIVVIESGEELDYRVERALMDPVAK